MGIFEQLAWLTTRVKRLCCAVEQIQQSGAGSYKVYTALLTQNGGSSVVDVSSGTLTVGVTYTIDVYGNGDDFTNVGAPNNNNGILFVATGTTPNNWSNGTNLQYNEGAPVVTVLENTIGNIYWTYSGIGLYYANSNGLFIPNKTDLQISQNNANGAGGNGNFIFYQGYQNNDDVIVFTTIDVDLANQISPSADNALSSTPIEIRVYN